MKILRAATMLLCFALLIPFLPAPASAGQLPVFEKKLDFFASDLYDVAYGKNIYIAVGGDGAIVRSEDAVNWKVVASGTSVKFRSIAFGNGIFVAVGNNNTIMTSSDGLSWKKQSITLTTKNVSGMKEANKGDFARNRAQFNTSVLWDGKQFVVLTQMDAYVFKANKGMSSTGYAFVSTSKDGSSWKTAQVAPYLYHANQLKYLNGAYYLFSDYQVMTSTNLVKWTSVDKTYIDAAYSPQGFAVLQERVETSRPRPAVLKAATFQAIKSAQPQDLLDWTDSSGANSLDYVHDHYIVNADSGYLAVSADASTWKTVNVFEQGGALDEIHPERITFYKTIWDGKQYVSVSSFGGIYTSPDLVQFEKQTVQGASPIGADLYGAGFAEGTYYLYGSNGRFLTSEDARNWKQTAGISKEENVMSADYNGKDFGLVTLEEDWYWKSLRNNYKFIFISGEDEAVRSKTLSSFDTPVDMKWDGQAFVGRTSFGSKYKWNSGASEWQDISPANPQELDHEPTIVKGDGMTVKYEYSKDNGMALYYLENGKWLKAKAPAWSDYERHVFKDAESNSKRGDTLSTIIYGNKEFMAVGAGGTILRSLDGKTWTRVKSGTSEYLNGIVWDGQRYIVVGNKGTYLTSTGS